MENNNNNAHFYTRNAGGEECQDKELFCMKKKTQKEIRGNINHLNTAKANTDCIYIH